MTSVDFPEVLSLESSSDVVVHAEVRFGDKAGDSAEMLRMCGSLVGWDQSLSSVVNPASIWRMRDAL